MNETWDSTPEREGIYGGSNNDPETFIRVNGSNIPITSTDGIFPKFKDVVKRTALESGLGKFRVFMNGEEFKPSQIGESLVEKGSRIELRPYDEAG